MGHDGLQGLGGSPRGRGGGAIGEPPWDLVEGPQYLHDVATNAIPRIFPTFGFIFNHTMSEVLHALAPEGTSLNDGDFAPSAPRLVQVGEATAAEVRRLM